MKNRKIALGLAAALTAAPLGAALAQTASDSERYWLPSRERTFSPGIFVGGGIGYYRVDEQDFFGPGDDLDDDQVSFKVYAGGDLLPWLGVEAGYVNFGEIGGSGASLDADGWSVAAIAQLPIGNFAPYAKAGHLWWDTDSDSASFGNPDGHDWFGGLGLRFALTQAIDMRLEYERYEVADADVDMGSLNLQLQF